MMRNQRIGAYRTTQVTTRTNQKELIVMAYDGILRFLSEAKRHMADREVEAAHNSLVRARDVVEELASTLNMDSGGVIARNLWNLYVFFIEKITEANLTKDPSHVEGILPAIRDLREAWLGLEISKDDTKTLELNHRMPVGDDAHRLSIAG